MVGHGDALDTVRARRDDGQLLLLHRSRHPGEGSVRRRVLPEQLDGECAAITRDAACGASPTSSRRATRAYPASTSTRRTDTCSAAPTSRCTSARRGRDDRALEHRLRVGRTGPLRRSQGPARRAGRSTGVRHRKIVNILFQRGRQPPLPHRTSATDAHRRHVALLVAAEVEQVGRVWRKAKTPNPSGRRGPGWNRASRSHASRRSCCATCAKASRHPSSRRISTRRWRNGSSGSATRSSSSSRSTKPQCSTDDHASRRT